MLIRHFQDLERKEGHALDAELVKQGARDRLAPILATATALALIALPFVVMGSRPGLEVIHPMAVVILGGLVSTTFLSLFVLPALYLRFAVAHEPSVTPEDELLHRWAGVQPEPAGAAPGSERVASPGTAANGDSVPAKDAAPAATDSEREATQ